MKTVQATQEASRIQHLQNMKFLYFIFIFLWVIFGHLDPDPADKKIVSL